MWCPKVPQLPSCMGALLKYISTVAVAFLLLQEKDFVFNVECLI